MPSMSSLISHFFALGLFPSKAWDTGKTAGNLFFVYLTKINTSKYHTLIDNSFTQLDTVQ